MLSVSVSDRIRFKTKKGEVVTALPVTVEFGKFVRGDKTSRISNTEEWNRLNLGGYHTEQVLSPSDLLHAVVALYNVCLSEQTAEELYRRVCLEGAKTLLLIRDTSEILKEWENRAASIQSGSRDSLGEINNNPIEKKNGDEDSAANTSQESSTIPEHTSEEECSNSGCFPNGNEEKSWIFRDQKREEGNVDVLNKNGLVSSVTSSSKTERCTRTEMPFSNIFSDSLDSDSDSNGEEEEEDNKQEYFKGLQKFLKMVENRRNETKIAQERYSLQPSHVGIEHRLIACATFHKEYNIPGIRVVNLILLAVRKRYRKCCLGRYLVERLKNPSQVGPYDALVVEAKNSSQKFFKKNSFVDDAILCSKFRDIENFKENSKILCYLPPFDGHYPALPGVQCWNNPESLACMQEEVDRWRQKSLESFQSYFGCLTRLKQEISRLHNLLRRQALTIVLLKKKNEELQNKLSEVDTISVQSLIEVLQTEKSQIEKSLQQPKLA
ncbi:uncharacterized protein [Centruroides vittatus]|uniref:uncharacterized protein n=1 Tax=Centruroides vittatus TaxID=120091 RepID=UPI0035104C0E